MTKERVFVSLLTALLLLVLLVLPGVYSTRSSGQSLAPVAQPPASAGCLVTSTVSSNFNSQTISSGNYIWFSSVLKLNPVPSSTSGLTLTIKFTGQQIVITPHTGSAITLTLPDAEVVYSDSFTTATTTFSSGMWVTDIPWSSAGTGNQFLSGFAYLVPTGVTLAQANPVTWSGSFSIISSSSTNPGSQDLNWQWAAAQYPSTFMSGGYSGLGVKPIDANTGSAYLNSDHAGTPENYKSDVIAGARGGGGSNYTGSLSPTGKVSCMDVVTPQFPWGTILAVLTPLAAFGAFGLAMTRRQSSIKIARTAYAS